MATAMASAALAQFDGPAPVVWRFLQPTSAPPGGAPLVSGNTIYQSVGGRVFAIDKESGNLVWRFPQVDPIPGVFRHAPVLAGGTLFAAGDNRLIYAFDATTGALRWSAPTPSGITSIAAVGNALVYASADNKLNALNQSDGVAQWTAPYNVFDGISGSIATNGNSILYFTNRQMLMSIDLTTRDTNWKLRFSQVQPNPTPVVVDDVIYAVSGPYLIAVNAVSGTAKWQMTTGLQISQIPAVSSEAIFITSIDGMVNAYRPDSTLINKKPVSLGTTAVAGMTAVGSKVIVPTSEGGVMLVDPATGEIGWNYIIRPIPKPGGSSSNSMGNPPGGNPNGQGNGRGNQDDEPPVTVQASGPASLAGNMLIVPARDGSVIAFDKDLGVDLTAPTVKMIFPNAGDQVSGQPPLVLAFKLQDEASGVNTSSLKVEVDGQTLEHTFTKDGLLIVRFTLSGKNKPLSDGRKVISVTASDWMGNSSKTDFSLTIDNALPPVKLPGSDDQNNRNGGPPGGGRGGGGGGGNSG